MEEYKTDAEIYAVLEREIIDLTLRPGSSLSENPLCARFGAPRSMIFGIAILKSVAAMAVVGGEREIPPRGNLLRSGKTGTQQMAGAGTLYPEQTVHLRAFVVTLVRPAWATTRW